MKDLTNNEIQVLLTGTFGDGTINKPPGCITSRYNTNCIHEEYLLYKANLLSYFENCIRYVPVNGYSGKPIYTYRTRVQPGFGELHSLSILDKLDLMDELGFALWLYDDGSLHKNDFFYNINTHAFSELDNHLISEKINEKFGILSKVTSETKKDGRKFFYLIVGVNRGAHTIAKILSKYPIECYKYKLWKPERIAFYDAMVNEAIKSGATTTDEISKVIYKLKRKYKFK